jgi:hypothetical protein
LKTYPQLVPFSSLKAPVKLRITGNDALALKSFKNCNFNFDVENKNAAIAQISFLSRNNKPTIRYSLLDEKGKTIVAEQSFSYKDPTKAGIELAYRLCGVGGTEPKKTANP